MLLQTIFLKPFRAGGGEGTLLTYPNAGAHASVAASGSKATADSAVAPPHPIAYRHRPADYPATLPHGPDANVAAVRRGPNATEPASCSRASDSICPSRTLDSTSAPACNNSWARDKKPIRTSNCLI